MALAIVEVLSRSGRVVQDDLASVFTRRYRANSRRDYGATAHGVLAAIGAGEPWQAASGLVFGGVGSMGNGAAMRVAPLGAYWADDYASVVEQARLSAGVTHAHSEGQRGPSRSPSLGPVGGIKVRQKATAVRC